MEAVFRNMLLDLVADGLRLAKPLQENLCLSFGFDSQNLVFGYMPSLILPNCQ